MNKKIVNLFRYEIIDGKIYKKAFRVYENNATYSPVDKNCLEEKMLMYHHIGELYKEDLDFIRPFNNNPTFAMFTLNDNDDFYKEKLSKIFDIEIEECKNKLSRIETEKQNADMSKVLPLEKAPIYASDFLS